MEGGMTMAMAPDEVSTPTENFSSYPASRSGWSTIRPVAAPVAVLDRDEKPLEGYSLDDCLAVSGDGMDLHVRWKDHADLSAAAGQTVHLRFELKNARLYSYRRGD